MRPDAEGALVGPGYDGGHQLPVAHGPGRRPAHRLLGEAFRRIAVEVRAVEDESGRVRQRPAGEQADGREQQLGGRLVAAVEYVGTHQPAVPPAVASSRAASAASYMRVDCPIPEQHRFPPSQRLPATSARNHTGQ